MVPSLIKVSNVNLVMFEMSLKIQELWVLHVKNTVTSQNHCIIIFHQKQRFWFSFHTVLRCSYFDSPLVDT